MMRCSMRSLFKVAGCAVLSFGLGTVLTYFLPCSVLVTIEGIIIIVAGTVYLLNK